MRNLTDRQCRKMRPNPSRYAPLPQAAKRTVEDFMRLHPLLKLLAINLALGLALAGVIVGGLLLTDAHGLRSLIERDSASFIALALLTFGFAVTFGSVLMGAAVMLLPDRGDEPPSGGKRQARRRDAVPVRVTVPARARRRD
jgi:hypothetical protein